MHSLLVCNALEKKGKEKDIIASLHPRQSIKWEISITPLLTILLHPEKQGILNRLVLDCSSFNLD